MDIKEEEFKKEVVSSIRYYRVCWEWEMRKIYLVCINMEVIGDLRLYLW